MKDKIHFRVNFIYTGKKKKMENDYMLFYIFFSFMYLC